MKMEGRDWASETRGIELEDSGGTFYGPLTPRWLSL